jgi:23S rRNA (uracil1939-C5)-methyltransferase
VISADFREKKNFVIHKARNRYLCHMDRRTKKELPMLQQVVITGVAAEGKAIARVNDKVLFVPYAAPGDVVDVRITLKKKHFMEGEIVKLHSAGPDRTAPFCEHFGLCGGCKWQHLPYPAQVEFKRQQVVDALERIGGFKGIVVDPVIASPIDRYYRNKLEYTFTSRRWLTQEELGEGENRPVVDFWGLGFHLPGQYDRILHIDTCYLQPEPSDAIRRWTAEKCRTLHIPFYNHRTKDGVLRNLIIRNNSRGEFMVVLIVREEHPHLSEVLQGLQDTFPQIASLHLAVNPKRNDDLGDIDIQCLAGTPWLTDEMDGLQFRIGPKSFYQTNPAQVVHLYRKALEFAELSGHETVYDLYTGTGTIALFAARHAGNVVGIEYVDKAIEDAKENARFNGTGNAEFFAGDIAKVMDDIFIEQHGNPHVIITDPPRGGMHPDVVRKIVEMGPNRIVYVSCNPATQARDAALMAHCYRITAVQPVDMFPHTHHIENVVLMERR